MHKKYSKRFTCAITNRAFQNMKRVAKVLNLTQWELTSLLLERADEHDGDLKRAAQETLIEKKNIRESNKKLRAKLRALTPQQIKKALSSL